MSTLRPAPWLKIYDELGVVEPSFDDRPLGTHVERHAAERPDAIAIQYLGNELTYAEVNREANRLANALESLGVGQNDVVGLHMPNIPNYLIAVTAISKLGCSGTGVSPMLKAGELVYQLQDAGVSVLLSHDQLTAELDRHTSSLPSCLKYILIVSDNDYSGGQPRLREAVAERDTLDYLSLLSVQSDEFEQVPVTPDQRFMIQYTGGTTGRPKGAQLSVRNLLHNCEQGFATNPWRDYQEVLATAFPYFHAAGLYTIILSFRYGARALVIPNARDIEAFCREMAKSPPTRLMALPTLYMMLLNCPLVDQVDFSGLQSATTGAAPLAMEDRLRIEAVLGKGFPTDILGMTETSPVHVANPPQRMKIGTCGIPAPGADTRIVDAETGTREMPFGEPGEIITSGPQVMLGYLNLPDETAKAIRELDGRTWMYTGDIGFMDEEGYITVCDRAKDMLIVGGFKVFSVEVEDKLKALDFIAESALVGTPDEARPGNDIVNLYVQVTPVAADRDRSELESEIIAFCRENMSAYKVPKRVHFVDAIPLTTVGKIDKKALRSQALA